MLRVSALEVGNPVLFVILMKVRDASKHWVSLGCGPAASRPNSARASPAWCVMK